MGIVTNAEDCIALLINCFCGQNMNCVAFCMFDIQCTVHTVAHPVSKTCSCGISMNASLALHENVSGHDCFHVAKRMCFG